MDKIIARGLTFQACHGVGAQEKIYPADLSRSIWNWVWICRRPAAPMIWARLSTMTRSITWWNKS